MTNREFLTAVSVCETCSEEIREHALAALAKMDAANEARKNKPSKKATENAPLIEKIVTEVLGIEAVTASTVAETMGISTQKASALLRAIVAEGRAEVTEVKLPKRGTVKAYTAVAAD